MIRGVVDYDDVFIRFFGVGARDDAAEEHALAAAGISVRVPIGKIGVGGEVLPWTMSLPPPLGRIKPIFTNVRDVAACSAVPEIFGD